MKFGILVIFLRNNSNEIWDFIMFLRNNSNEIWDFNNISNENWEFIIFLKIIQIEPEITKK
jgi:hypothetical protein